MYKCLSVFHQASLHKLQDSLRCVLDCVRQEKEKPWNEQLAAQTKSHNNSRPPQMHPQKKLAQLTKPPARTPMCRDVIALVFRCYPPTFHISVLE